LLCVRISVKYSVMSLEIYGCPVIEDLLHQI
jgi:hypothetical protein